MLAPKKVLLLYISVLSGHHRAAIAVEKAVKALNPEAVVYNINAFHYTNPILEKVINRTYTSIIKRTPEVWEYIYDNPKIIKNTQAIKDMIHRYNSSKMRALIEDLDPDVIACTQAFPCGMVADYKATHSSSVPLLGILTDFYPHSYWIYETVDRFIVASEEARRRLQEDGVDDKRIRIFGIPVDPHFNRAVDTEAVKKSLFLDNKTKTVLIMGGSAGLGPIRKMVLALDRIRPPLQVIVVTGTNTRLFAYLKRKVRRLKKTVSILGYTHNINEVMAISDLIITKPGGLTTSEALAKGLPIIIVNPIPGQESKNTQFLLQNHAALRVSNEEDLAILVENLITAPSKLDSMRQSAAHIGKPNSAVDTARLIMEL